MSVSVGTGRARVRVRGLVQGVGFRPFVHGLALRHQLRGWVKNDDAGVLLEVEGDDAASFLFALRESPPPLSRVDAVEITWVDAHGDGEVGFRIEDSDHASQAATTRIGADAAPCLACLRECFDPANRRYRYPFLNCTHCGPRYTITRALPYDRAQTSMARFPMCEACAAEYHDPANRRFHAQPTACPACGPRLSMPMEELARRILAGEIVAIKALGGYQLACLATSEAPVSRLRERKQRDGKPFAVMVPGVPSAERWAALDDLERSALTSVSRPIVLARKRQGQGLARAIAPDLPWVGLMLPSSPLHYLLFHELVGRPDGVDWLDARHDIALVMTSANPGGEPLCIDEDDARRRLGSTMGHDGRSTPIADAMVSHDRDIVVRCDDPVVRSIGGELRWMRRGRGTTPEPIALGRDLPPVLAVGAHLTNAICLVRGDSAFLSQHVGDMDDRETFRFFEETIAHLSRMLEVTPVAVAHDLHPDFLGTRWAEASGLRCIPVQHHHAHVAAVLAEHHRDGEHLGLALDGVGLGTDGAPWGGELLRVDGARMRRVARLRPLPLPGGDVAAREPWRMAVAALHETGRFSEIARRFGQRGLRLAASIGPRTPRTSSCGRLFDAATALLGLREHSGYEGEAPMVLEGLVRRPRVLQGTFRIEGGELDVLPLLDAIGSMSPEDGADAFHGTLAAALVELVLAHQDADDADTPIVLSGGCAQNRVLSEALAAGFAARGRDLLLPRLAPAGDGGLALGQAWVAAHQLSSEEEP